jgi:glycosyltransferase involved in cell wall biosynthesis
MRVLHVSAYYAPAFVYGGPPRSIHGLCRALRDAGIGAEVFTTDANGDAALPDAITSSGSYDGVPVRYFPRSWPQEPIGSRALTRALRSALPTADLLHIHGLWNRVVWSAAREARRARVPYVLSPRGMLEAGALAHRALRKRIAWTMVERATIDNAALLHATSDAEFATLKALRPEAGIVCVPNGVDAIAIDRRVDRPRPLVAFIGRLHPMKRIDLLVDAFVGLRARGRELDLAIAGPDEAGLRGALTARAGQFASEITWLGPVDAAQKADLLGRAAALVMCSDSESFGLSAAEAMSAGVPVVVTRTCGWAELPREQAGLLVEQSAAGVATGLMALLDDRQAAARMAERGRALIDRKYRWPVIASELVHHYTRTIETHRAAEVLA